MNRATNATNVQVEDFVIIEINRASLDLSARIVSGVTFEAYGVRFGVHFSPSRLGYIITALETGMAIGEHCFVSLKNCTEFLTEECVTRISNSISTVDDEIKALVKECYENYNENEGE